jgi:hypothetical protein
MHVYEREGGALWYSLPAGREVSSHMRDSEQRGAPSGENMVVRPVAV